MAPHGITVNAIAPGGVRTPMLGAALERNPGMEQAIVETVPLRRIAEPEELANTALFLASDEAAYYTGALLHVNGGTLPDGLIPKRKYFSHARCVKTIGAEAFSVLSPHPRRGRGRGYTPQSETHASPSSTDRRDLNASIREAVSMIGCE